MATYTVTGHPLNYADLGLSQVRTRRRRAQLLITGVGQTFTVALTGPDDTKVKGHGCLK
jgi:hypothetical protein